MSDTPPATFAPVRASASSATPVASTSRHAWADMARGLGIALVVIGHVLLGLFNAGVLAKAGAWAFVVRFIYVFHMPLFFLLAGVFLGARATESFAQLAWRRVVRLGYPYVLWGSAQIVLQALMSRHTNHPARLSDVWTIVYAPPMQFWFLYALLMHSLLLALLDKLGVPRLWSLLLSFAAFVAPVSAPLGEWGPFNQARTYLPFTALGLLLGPARIASLLQKPRALLVASSLLGFGVVAMAASTQLDERHVSHVPATIGSAATLALCGALAGARTPALLRVADTLRTWGLASMAIFVAHTIASAATRIILQRFLHIQDAAAHLVLGTIAGLAGPLLLWRTTERLRVPYLFEWPQRGTRSPTLAKP